MLGRQVLGIDGVQRDQACADDMLAGIFIRLADVDQQHAAAGKALLEGVGGDGGEHGESYICDYLKIWCFFGRLQQLLSKLHRGVV